MGLSKNTHRGYIGTPPPSGGVFGIDDELVLFQKIISTSQSITTDTITLGTVSAGNTIVIFTEKGGSNIGASSPSGFTQRVLSNGGNPRIAVYTKVATGTETTITGDWDVAASWVINGFVSVVGTPQGPTGTTTSTAPSINVLSDSLVAFLTVCNNNATVTTPPVGWTEEVRADGPDREIYVYSKEYSSSQATGDVTAVWTTTPVNSVLISFIG